MHRRRQGRRTLGLFAVVARRSSPPSSCCRRSRPPDAATPGGFRATGLVPDNTVTAAKSSSGRLATSDPALLGRTDSALVNVVVKLDYDATASYKGGVAGLAATSPSVTGAKLTGRSSAERAYEAYTSGLDETFRSRLGRGGAVGHRRPEPAAGLRRRRRAPPGQPGRQACWPSPASPPCRRDALQQARHRSRAPSSSVPRPSGPSSAARRSPARASSSATSTPASGRSTRCCRQRQRSARRRHRPRRPPCLQLRRQPADPGDRRVHVQQQAHRRPAVPRHLQRGRRAARSTPTRPVTATATAPTPPRRRPATRSPRADLRRRPRPDPAASPPAPGSWSTRSAALEGCFGSDSAAAVAQAILDGVNVINFSISGGAEPYSDPVELAFLDAYDAGVLVAASAGNGGPGAGDDRPPRPVGDHGRRLDPDPRVPVDPDAVRRRRRPRHLRRAPRSPPASPPRLRSCWPRTSPYYRRALRPPAARRARSPARSSPASAAANAAASRRASTCSQGGAVGHDPLQPDRWPTPRPTTTSCRPCTWPTAPRSSPSWPPTRAPPASFTAGRQGRRPGRRHGVVLLARPGRPVPQARHHRSRRADPGRQHADPGRGRRPARRASTSRRSPAPRCRRRTSPARRILLKALHPTWTPGQRQVGPDDDGQDRASSRRTCTTPADPFDIGAGRVDLTKAGNPALVFDESAAQHARPRRRPDHRARPQPRRRSTSRPCPARVTVTRTATNVTDQPFSFNVSTTAPAGVEDHGVTGPGSHRAGREPSPSR